MINNGSGLWSDLLQGPFSSVLCSSCAKRMEGEGEGGRTGSGAGARGKQVGRQAGRQQACNLYSAFGSGRVRSSRYIGNHSSKQSRRRMEKISSGNYWQRQQRCERHAVRSEQPQSQPKGCGKSSQILVSCGGHAWWAGHIPPTVIISEVIIMVLLLGK